MLQAYSAAGLSCSAQPSTRIGYADGFCEVPMHGLLLRLIACLEIAGGLYGAIATLIHWPTLRWGPDLLHASLALLLFGGSLAAGVALLEGRAWGRRGSIWLQLLQLPLLSSPPLSYAFHCGGFVHCYLSLQHSPKLDCNWQWTGQGLILMASGPAITRVGINPLALAAWLVLKQR